MTQTIRITEDLFLPDSELRVLLRLGPKDIILRVERNPALFYPKGSSKGQGLGVHGTIVTIHRDS